MKRVPFFIFVLMLFLSVTCLNCSRENIQDNHTVLPDTLSFSHSVKGWELYSWPNGTDWNYSILPGTNRVKNCTEVTTNKIVVVGLSSLKKLLDKLPAKEEIPWIDPDWITRIWSGTCGNLSLPDSRTLNEITRYCNQKGLLIKVID